MKVFDHELEEFLAYAILLIMFFGPSLEERFGQVDFVAYIIWGTIAIFLLIRYEFKQLRERVFVEKPGHAEAPPKN